MKYKNIIPFVALSTVLLTACDDNKMNWYDDPSHGEVTVSELPLPLAEKISRYDALKSYIYKPDFKLGIGVSLDNYLSHEQTTTIVNENFNDITISYDMKHGPMVGNDGELRLAKLDRLFAALEGTGVSVYGHTLIWHQNQNANYLKGLIAPTVIPPSPGESMLDLSGLADGNFTGWNRANNASGISIEEGKGLGSSDPAIKFVVDNDGDEWSTQLITPDIPVVEGHAIMLSFWVKSEGDGEIRASFANMSNNYPYYDGGTRLIPTGSTWTQVSYGVDGSWTATGSPIKINFDMGKVGGVTYYIDVNSIKVTDLDAEPTEFNYVTNGDFESGDLTNWSALNSGAGIEVTDEEKFAGSYSAKLTSSATSNQAHNLQLESSEMVLVEGLDYTFSFYIKSDALGEGRISFPGYTNQWPWMNWQGEGSKASFTTSSTWSQISVDLNDFTYAAGSNTIKLSFDLGYLPDVTYYVDDIKVVEKEPASRSFTRASGPTVIEKTAEEKAEIIGGAMEKWINEMMAHCKPYVHAWDVVNEPMDDGRPSQLKTGVNKELASDEFYWQDYLGKDYAVMAFKLARQADPNAILFINDYNLEYSLAKCDGIIEYMRYIESKGAQVDGIGTQMHISITSNKDNIVEMFKKMAATGKLVKITELDIKVNTKSPTQANLNEQAEMYRFVIDMYRKHVPEAQQFGITIWGVSDHPDEHINWIPDDAPNLWDANYARKHAYKAVADGLAGKDVSEDFTGELPQ
jgi:Beta-1,4-xylanase